MTLAWLRGLLTRRPLRVWGAATGVALTVAFLASLGAFLTRSTATMTQRAVEGVAAVRGNPVPWRARLVLGLYWPPPPSASTRADTPAASAVLNVIDGWVASQSRVDMARHFTRCLAACPVRRLAGRPVRVPRPGAGAGPRRSRAGGQLARSGRELRVPQAAARAPRFHPHPGRAHGRACPIRAATAFQGRRPPGRGRALLRRHRRFSTA
ncbi:MAG: hypothetical protein K6T35_11250, partial [Meiothermus silvanus]|nr:hypothetical protein [Allomeiothermus silvanus]